MKLIIRTMTGEIQHYVSEGMTVKEAQDHARKLLGASVVLCRIK